MLKVSLGEKMKYFMLCNASTDLQVYTNTTISRQQLQCADEFRCLQLFVHACSTHLTTNEVLEVSLGEEIDYFMPSNASTDLLVGA